MTEEPHEVRLKRLRMRAMRRGIKEMDLILSRYADLRLEAMDAESLGLFDRMLEENDQDLYAWITGRDPVPGRYENMVKDILQAI